MNVTLAPESKRTTPPPSRSIVTEPSVGAWTTSPATTASPAASGRVRAPERTVAPASTLAVWPSSTIAGPLAVVAEGEQCARRQRHDGDREAREQQLAGALRPPRCGGRSAARRRAAVAAVTVAAATVPETLRRCRRPARAGGAGDTAGRGGGLDRTKGSCGPPSAA